MADRAPVPLRSGVASALAAYRPLRHKKVTVSIGLWLFGLFVVFLAPPPAATTPESIAAFEAKMVSANQYLPALEKAELRLLEAELDMAQSQVWFWRFREPYKSEVAAKRPAVAAAQAETRTLQKQWRKAVAAAKSELGVWSLAGVEEGRSLLWANFDAGKKYARERSMWDAAFTVIFSGGSGREGESEGLGLLIRVLLKTLWNFIVSLIASIVVFAFQLPSFLASFQAGWLSGAVFFAVAVVGAVALVFTYLSLLCAAGAATTYAVVSFASVAGSNRLTQEQRQRRQERLHYD